MGHSAAKMDIRYENDRIILRGEPTLIHQEAERIIGRFRFSDRSYRLQRSGRAGRADLMRLVLTGCAVTFWRQPPTPIHQHDAK